MEGRIADDGVVGRGRRFAARGRANGTRRAASVMLARAASSARCSASIRSIRVTPDERARTSRAEIAPAAAEIGDVARQIVRQMPGEQGRAVVDPVPAEDAGLAHPRAVAHRLQRGEAAPVVGRLASRRASARRRGNGISTASRRGRAPCATCFSRLAAPSSLAPAQTSVPPRLEQRPAARDVGEVLLLVLGQQQPARAARRRSRCAARPTSRSVSGGDTRAGTIARRRCP